MTEVPQSNEDPNIPIDDDRNRPIHVAAAGGDENWVCKELNRGAKVDVENYLGWTPLMMATRNGHLKVATLLLQYKADATKKNKFGEWKQKQSQQDLVFTLFGQQQMAFKCEA